jgi:hypothetical protein
MQSPLQSNWQVSSLLSQLPGFQRVDDGWDLLAFRISGTLPKRFVYVYLYGNDPDEINYDLEDESSEAGEWDNAVSRGAVRSVADLRTVCEPWLNGKER